MGSMATDGLGRDFMIGFPILVVVLCLLTIFNVYSKIGAMCCIKRLRYLIPFLSFYYFHTLLLLFLFK